MKQGKLTQDLLSLVKTHVYQFRSKPFLLASGRKSQHYYDCKEITMVPEYLEKLARALRDDLIPQFMDNMPQAVGGMTLGADPIAYSLSLAYWEKGHRAYPVVVRKKSKDHGTARLVEAKFDSKAIQKVLVLDDVVTTGKSSLQAIEALRKMNFTIEYCVAIIDREEGEARP